MKKRYLILQDGTIFEGTAFGAEQACVGELVFTTAPVGYLETITDPSYCGQIVVQCFPLIGNYGVIEEDFEGVPALSGYVVRHLCHEPSNYRAQYNLDKLLKDKGVPGISGVDVRRITEIIRDAGVMNAAIADEIPSDLSFLPEYRIVNAVERVSTKERKVLPAQGAQKYEIALIDYGEKRNIARSLVQRGCRVTILPHNVSAEEVLALRPDGVMLSNGPGDPAENTACIAEIQKLLGKVPIMGICLGHQLLALANGCTTRKMKFGHRGANQPVRDLRNNRCYITSQNHGYEVVADSIHTGKPLFVHVNDATCEGIAYPKLNAWSVQFHPEACPGPRDTEFLFDQYLQSI